MLELRSIYGSQLNCKYKYYPDVGYTCELNTTISENEESFEFGGEKEDNRKVKTLLFTKFAPSFIPKEVFETFPQLDAVGIYHTETKLIDLKFLSNLLKNAYELNTLYLAYNRIEMMEPKVLALLKNFRTIRLEGNTCVKQKIKIQHCNLNEVKANLTTCFENFFTNFPDKNTTEQQQILENEAIPEYVFISGQSQIFLSYSVFLIVLIVNIVMSRC